MRAGTPARRLACISTCTWTVVGRRGGRALERAVTNLLDNAAKWSPPQGGTVRSRSTGGTLWSPTRGQASPTRTCRTCSTGSTAHRVTHHARLRARALDRAAGAAATAAPAGSVGDRAAGGRGVHGCACRARPSHAGDLQGSHGQRPSASQWRLSLLGHDRGMTQLDHMTEQPATPGPRIPTSTSTATGYHPPPGTSCHPTVRSRCGRRPSWSARSSSAASPASWVRPASQRRRPGGNDSSSRSAGEQLARRRTQRSAAPPSGSVEAVAQVGAALRGEDQRAQRAGAGLRLGHHHQLRR